MNIVSIGCDPEIFLQDSTGKIRSAIGLFGGTKEKPNPLKPLGPGYAVQEDNILMEFNTPPATTPAEFVDCVQKTVDFLSKRASRMGLSFAKGSAYSVDPAELEHPRAKVFGCDPDYNAYTGEANPSPQAKDKHLRSAGGHIAFGISEVASAITQRHLQEYCVRKLDYMLGLPSILLDDGMLRKELYGKAGAYRPKSYGLEYRTLSNFWVFSPEITKAMLTDVVTFFNKNSGIYSSHVSEFERMTQLAIDTNNKDFAAWVIKRSLHFTHLKAINAI